MVGVIAVSTLPYAHPTTSTPTTCGSGNDVFGFNVKNRCSIQGDDFRGQDRVWTFVPTRGGCVRVQFTGDTLNGNGWINMKLLIYEDNPPLMRAVYPKLCVSDGAYAYFPCTTQP